MTICGDRRVEPALVLECYAKVGKVRRIPSIQTYRLPNQFDGISMTSDLLRDDTQQVSERDIIFGFESRLFFSEGGRMSPLRACGLRRRHNLLRGMPSRRCQGPVPSSARLDEIRNRY